ncbi:glycosyltransferase [Anaerobacillus sp. HL2]|nr:glycosyltransferase [Anaerobacillus sp. HL2]
MIEAIASVIEQTYKSWELIVLDDASKDNTVSIIKELSNKDDRIRFYINEKNKGVASYKKQRYFTCERGLDCVFR